MTGPRFAIAAVLLLSACKAEVTPAERAAQDARAIAMVEAAQGKHPPPIAIDPQPISGEDRTNNRLYGAGCELLLADAIDRSPVLLLNDRRATIRLDGRIVTLASDPGSTQMPLGTWSHYVGKRYSLVVTKSAGDGTRLGEEVQRWDGEATIRDSWNQIVYKRSGALECGA